MITCLSILSSATLCDVELLSSKLHEINIYLCFLQFPYTLAWCNGKYHQFKSNYKIYKKKTAKVFYHRLERQKSYPIH